jgi:catechol 2,3-dioxygenase-like lactoylglutathione lyase family enzyme
MNGFDAKTYDWARCTPEVLVTDFQTSLAFYKMLGFIDMYQREHFAYLDYQGAQFMIFQRNNWWETGEMEWPFGRGVNFQFATNELDALMARIEKAGVLFYEGKQEKWRDLGGHRGGSVEFLVQDPDGYLLRFLQKIE